MTTSIDALAGIAAIDAANEGGDAEAAGWDFNQVTALTGSPTGQQTGSTTNFYLDDTPAFQSQIDSSAAAAAKQARLNKNAATRQQNALAQTSMMAGVDYSGAKAERARTMGATMGGGPSYDPLVTGEEQLTEPDYQTEAEASSWGLDLHAALRQMSGMKETDKYGHYGMKSARWHPDMAKWSSAKQKDFLAGFDKTLGAAKTFSQQKTGWENKNLLKDKQAIWDKVEKLVGQYTTEETLGKLMNSGYNMTQLTSLVQMLNDSGDTSNLRDIIRHGIATNKYGLAQMTAYEIFKSGSEISDYKNNLAAAMFAKTLSPDEDFDQAWTAAVIQEKLNPGSTGLNLDWSAGTEDDPTIGDWWGDLWGAYRPGGLFANPNQQNMQANDWRKLAEQAQNLGKFGGGFPAGFGIIRQVEGGG